MTKRTEGRALAHLRANPGATIGQIAGALGLANNSVSSALSALRRRGVVLKSDRFWPWRWYCVDASARFLEDHKAQRQEKIRKRFMSRVRLPPVARAEADCWEWGGRRNPKGYGRFKIGRRPHEAHRVAYTLMVGVIPDGMIVCHHCDNPPCVNPAHLFVGTHQDNCDDKIAKGREATLAGERNGRSKLTAAMVRQIRASTETNTALARRMGVTPGSVSKVRTGRTWSHV